MCYSEISGEIHAYVPSSIGSCRARVMFGYDDNGLRESEWRKRKEKPDSDWRRNHEKQQESTEKLSATLLTVCVCCASVQTRVTGCPRNPTKGLAYRSTGRRRATQWFPHERHETLPMPRRARTADDSCDARIYAYSMREDERESRRKISKIA